MRPVGDFSQAISAASTSSSASFLNICGQDLRQHCGDFKLELIPVAGWVLVAGSPLLYPGNNCLDRVLEVERKDGRAGTPASSAYMLTFPCRRILGFLLGCFALLGCTTTVPELPVNGELGGQRIATTVDSELARYYLEEYLSGNKTDPDLDAIIQTVENKKHEHSRFDAKFLQDVSARLSVDFATLYLANRILNDRLNQPVQSLFHNELAMIRRARGIEQFASDPTYSGYVLLFVPGWFYQTDPWTGADLAKQRAVAARLGLEHYLVDIEDNGTIEENASILAAQIAHYARKHKKIILVSVSKAGAEVALALGEVMDEVHTRLVKAWINIGGLLQGSLIADSALR